MALSELYRAEVIVAALAGGVDKRNLNVTVQIPEVGIVKVKRVVGAVDTDPVMIVGDAASAADPKAGSIAVRPDKSDVHVARSATVSDDIKVEREEHVALSAAASDERASHDTLSDAVSDEINVERAADVAL
ncbi:hypothetical protein HDU93_002301, partial [Gonapodya sp. JEL0774]